MLLIKEIIMIRHCCCVSTCIEFCLSRIVRCCLILVSLFWTFVPALMAILSTPEVPNAKHNSDWHSKLSARLFGASSQGGAYFPVGRSNGVTTINLHQRQRVSIRASVLLNSDLARNSIIRIASYSARHWR